MNGEWCYFKSYFNADYCNQIIRDLEVVEFQRSAVGFGESAIEDTSVRRSRVKFINTSDWRFSYIFEELWKTAISANKDFFDFHISKLDFFQFTEYSASNLGEYKRHQDVFWMNDDPKYHRKLSCVIQLSDPLAYDGGDFELFDVQSTPNKEDIRLQGTVIFFPSFIFHQVNPVTRGTRYSIVAWFEGPKWR